MRIQDLAARGRRLLSVLPILPVVIGIWALAVLVLLAVAIIGFIAVAGVALVLIFRAATKAWRGRVGHTCSTSTYFRGYCRVCGTKMEDLS